MSSALTSGSIPTSPAQALALVLASDKTVLAAVAAAVQGMAVTPAGVSLLLATDMAQVASRVSAGRPRGRPSPFDF